jgi:formylglycine-generating enzyme required for sulfatase activity
MTKQVSPRAPVVGVRPSDAIDFCQWLTVREQSHWCYRMPFEGEALGGHLSQACRQYATQSSTSFADRQLGNAHIANEESVKNCAYANQIRAYWWCSPPRIARQRMRPAVSTARDIGASLCNDK